jgi:hypothetical protein
MEGADAPKTVSSLKKWKGQRAMSFFRGSRKDYSLNYHLDSVRLISDF